MVDYRRLLRKYRLRQLEPLVEDSIRVKAAATPEEHLPIGLSRLGGRPDLPEEFSWPDAQGRPMAFLGMFRLEEVSPYDIHRALPSAGFLYFFYDAVKQPWGYDPEDRGSWRVVYHDGPISSLRRVPFPDALPAEVRFLPCTLTFSSEETVPPYDSLPIEDSDLKEDDLERYAELLEEAARPEDEAANRLLGHPDQIQNEMQSECQLASHGVTNRNDPRAQQLLSLAQEWRLFFQVDSDASPGFQWGDVGRIYYWITRDALRTRDFKDVWLSLQCY